MTPAVQGVLCVIDGGYPGGIVSEDGHPLEVGHFQVGGRVHLHFNHRGSR